MMVSDLIKSCGKSRAQICADVGISRAMLSLIENGHRKIGALRAAKFARCIGVPLSAVRPDLAEIVGQSSDLEGSE